MLGCAYSSPALRAAGDDVLSSDPVQVELGVERQIHDAASIDDYASVGSLMSSAAKAKGDEPTSVVLARRAATVCGWLQNENQYGRAAKLASLVVKRIANQKEPDTASHVERLYWESLLVGRYMDQKAVAVKLLEEAAQLAPKDDRVGSLEQEFADALAQFGR